MQNRYIPKNYNLVKHCLDCLFINQINLKNMFSSPNGFLNINFRMKNKILLV